MGCTAAVKPSRHFRSQGYQPHQAEPSSPHVVQIVLVNDLPDYVNTEGAILDIDKLLARDWFAEPSGKRHSAVFSWRKTDDVGDSIAHRIEGQRPLHRQHLKQENITTEGSDMTGAASNVDDTERVPATVAGLPTSSSASESRTTFRTISRGRGE